MAKNDINLTKFKNNRVLFQSLACILHSRIGLSLGKVYKHFINGRIRVFCHDIPFYLLILGKIDPPLYFCPVIPEISLKTPKTFFFAQHTYNRTRRTCPRRISFFLSVQPTPIIIEGNPRILSNIYPKVYHQSFMQFLQENYHQ